MVYVNPAGFPTPGLPNHGYKLFITLMVMCVTAGLFVIARLATRISQAQIGADDWTILAGMISFLVQTTLWGLSVRAGYGADYLSLADWQRRLFNQWWFFGSIFWLCTLTLYKLSILFLLNRIFVQRAFKIVCWSTLVITVCWSVANIFGWIFQCLPVRAMWGDILPTTKVVCLHQHALWYSIVAWDVSTDAAILLMPQPMVWKLNLKKREKLMLMGMFLMGAVVILFSLMSCSSIAAALPHAQEKNQYSFALANIFQVLETGMGMIGACLPILRQPVRTWFPRLMGRSTEETEFYYDDNFREQYAMQNVASGEKHTKPQLQAAWNSVSVSGPQSSKRESDELYILPSNDNMEEVEHGSGQQPIRIIKETEYSIQRA